MRIRLIAAAISKRRGRAKLPNSRCGANTSRPCRQIQAASSSQMHLSIYFTSSMHMAPCRYCNLASSMYGSTTHFVGVCLMLDTVKQVNKLAYIRLPPRCIGPLTTTSFVWPSLPGAWEVTQILCPLLNPSQLRKTHPTAQHTHVQLWNVAGHVQHHATLTCWSTAASSSSSHCRSVLPPCCCC